VFTPTGGIAPAGEFRNNVSQGGAISFAEFGRRRSQFAVEVAASVDLMKWGWTFAGSMILIMCLEPIMVYGLEGFRRVRTEYLRYFQAIG